MSGLGTNLRRVAAGRNAAKEARPRLLERGWIDTAGKITPAGKDELYDRAEREREEREASRG